MTNEIKEIINDLQRVADRKCYPEDILDGSIAQEWVDYITNLQEENEYNNFCNEKLREKITNLEYKISTYEDLQQRIDKSVEYISCHFKEMVADEEAQELLDILRGDE